MGKSRLCAGVLIVALTAGLPAWANSGGIGISTVPEDVEAPQTFRAAFLQYRPGSPLELRYRDLEFHWDALYDSMLTDPVRTTLNQLGTMLAGSFHNPFGAELTDMRLASEYFRLASSPPYSTNPIEIPFVTDSMAGQRYDATNGVLLENFPMPQAERTHLDSYIYVPGHLGQYNGQYPSNFLSFKEDSNATNWRIGAVDTADVFPGNAVMVPGPPNDISRHDVNGTGWTAPDRLLNWGTIHEFQHALRDSSPSTAVDEVFSSGAEAIVGNQDHTFAHEVPYRRPFLTSPNYQHWRLLTAYLAYNFRGLDVAPTLAGFSDDLLFRWSRRGRGLDDLRDLLTNANCAECELKPYFNPGGSPLDSRSRLNLLLHNWRVANFVNSMALADSQYGYPPEFDFIPSRDVGNWQRVYSEAECPGCDMDAIPPEVTARRAWLTRDTTIAGVRWRPDLEWSRQMLIQGLASDYWVIRSAPELLGDSLDMHVRINPESLSTAIVALNNSPCFSRDGRLLATVVAYDVPADSLGADLWRHAEWATSVWGPQWVDVDSAAAPLEFVVPGFGSDHTAAVVVLSAGDGPGQGISREWELGFNAGSSTAVKYRINFGLRSAPYDSENPRLVRGGVQIQEHPAWSPPGDRLAYVEQDGSGHRQIWIETIGVGRSFMNATSSPESQDFPEWSPRGDWLAYSQRRTLAPYTDLFVFNLNTQEERILTTSLDAEELCPAFSPNGQAIAYLARFDDPSTSNDTLRVLLTGLDGATHTTLYERIGVTVGSLQWSQDGSVVEILVGDSVYSVGVTGGHTVAAVERLDPGVHAFHRHPAGGRTIMEHTKNMPILKFGTCGTPNDTMRVHRLALWDAGTQDDEPRFYRRNETFLEPRWSFDGTRIAYSVQPAGTSHRDVFVGQVSFNHAPAWVTIPADVTVTTCAPVTIDLDAADPDGETVKYFGAMLPPGAAVDSTTGVFIWDPPTAGDTYVVLRARDGSGGVAQRVVKISVPDQVRPAATEITGVFASSTSIALEWTSVGDDSLTGSACRYELKRHSSTITEANWGAATHVAQSIAPQAPGNTEFFEVEGLQPNTWYYFAVKTRDEAGDHFSALSNVVAVKTLSGGGGGFAARRAGGEGGGTEDDAQALGAPASAGMTAADANTPAIRPAFERDAGSTSLIGATEAIAVELERGSAGLSWQIYRLSGFEAAALAGRGAQAGVLLQVPSAEGWQTHSSIAPSAACSVLALTPPHVVHGRAVLLGGHDLTRVSESGVVAGRAYQAVAASHSRQGDQLAALAPAAGAFDLEAGDTLSLAYASGEVADPGLHSWFLAFRRAGGTAAGEASQIEQQPGAALPTSFALAQNRPNPFAAATRIHFDLPRETRVHLEVFDLFGRRVAVLADHGFPAGFHAVDWDRRAGGARVQPGVYIYRMQAGGFTAQRKLVLLP